MFGWSPDSKQFAFTGTYNGKTGLYVVNVQNSGINLLYENANLNVIKWSPEGTKIMFFELADASSWKLNIYVVNSDGTNLIKITKKPGYFESIQSTWGNDDSSIFLNDMQGMRGINLDTMQPNGETTLTLRDTNQKIIFSPDHKHYLTVNGLGRKIILANEDGSQKTDLSKNFNIINSIGSAFPNFQWSPDSKTIAYYDSKKNSIVLWSIEESKLSTLVTVTQDANSQYKYLYGQYLWLPDGKQIVFVQADGAGGFAICISDLSGNTTTLTTAKYPTSIYVEQIWH